MSFSRPPQAASAVTWTRRIVLLGSTALLASLVVTAGMSEAQAACSGVNTGTVLCDAANPSGGSLETSFAGATTVNINAGAAISLVSALPFNAAARVWVTGGTGDLIFHHSDPTGISGSFYAVNLTNSGTGATIYNGSANVTSDTIGIHANSYNGGAITITQTAGVVTGGSSGISAYGIGSDLTINTVGSQINGIIGAQIEDNGNITITTGAASGIAAQDSSSSGFGSVRITANGAIGSSGILVNGHGTGPIDVTTHAAVTGAWSFIKTTAPRPRR